MSEVRSARPPCKAGETSATPLERTGSWTECQEGWPARSGLHAGDVPVHNLLGKLRNTLGFLNNNFISYTSGGLHVLKSLT